ncbi:MAG: hypothetical protein U5K79_25890 [Cyclobacteriaceae bacterium]|nr:hypothetical protein [Cyclobacteriaceae bacterium]
MTDIEFQILDELYFLQSYSYLTKAIDFSDAQLSEGLRSLLKKGWIRCYRTPSEEIDFSNRDFDTEYWSYYYLASKAGLLAHNSND